MPNRILALVAVPLAALALTACGDDDDGGGDSAERTALTEATEATEAPGRTHNRGSAPADPFAQHLALYVLATAR